MINLVPDAQKPLVFTEIFRLLVPGGRVSISDILAKKALPEEIREDTGLYIGCVSGASELGEYEKWMKEAGFSGKWIEYTLWLTWRNSDQLITKISLLLILTRI